jgi:tetratricopeptide (TPR) repeat protein
MQERRPPDGPIQRFLARALVFAILAVMGAIAMYFLSTPHQQATTRVALKGLRDYADVSIRHPAIIIPLSRATFYEEVGLHQRAVNAYHEVLAVDPEFAWGYYGRASSYSDLGFIPAALDDLGMAMELDPDMVWAYNMRGLLYRDSLGDTEAARRDFALAITIEPDYAWAYSNLARVTLDPREALQYFQRALELGLENRPEVYTHRANAYAQLGQIHEAQADFEHAIDRDPGFPWIYYHRAHLNETLGRNEEAIADYNQFLALYPADDFYSDYALARIEVLVLARDDEFVK